MDDEFMKQFSGSASANVVTMLLFGILMLLRTCLQKNLKIADIEQNLSKHCLSYADFSKIWIFDKVFLPGTSRDSHDIPGFLLFKDSV